MSDLPQHIAIVMDGNRRWAKMHGLTALDGHRKVVDEVISQLIEHSASLKIPYLTLWAWSSENWDRPKPEVSGTMRLFRWALKHKANEFIGKGAKLNLIGDLEAFPDDIRRGLEEMMERSKDNNRIIVTYALNYGGRDEIVRAVNRIVERDSIASSVEGLQNDIRKLTEKDITRNLDTHDMPDPDLIIRPGGQKRLSGFLTWQSIYSELYFTDTLMPDFGPDELDKAIEDYMRRKRTFGGGGFEEVGK